MGQLLRWILALGQAPELIVPGRPLNVPHVEVSLWLNWVNLVSPGRRM